MSELIFPHRGKPKLEGGAYWAYKASWYLDRYGS